MSAAHGQPFAVMLVAADHARLLAGFTLAAGALAMGRDVRIFATGAALAALLDDYAPPEDAALEADGLAGVVTLRDVSVQMGARLLACDSALHAARLDPGRLCAGAAVAGIPSLIEGAAPPAVF